MEINRQYKLIVISMFFVLLVFGIYLGFNFSKDSKATKATVSSIDEVAPTTNNNEGKISDVELIYNDHYSLCGETVTKSEMIYSVNVDKLAEEEIKKQREENLDYQIEEKKDGKLVFTRTISQNCPNHFLVKLVNGKVMIYNVLSDDMKVEYRTIDISQELIRPEMIEELNNGIRVNTKEDLNMLIEDIES